MTGKEFKQMRTDLFYSQADFAEGVCDGRINRYTIARFENGENIHKSSQSVIEENLLKELSDPNHPRGKDELWNRICRYLKKNDITVYKFAEMTSLTYKQLLKFIHNPNTTLQLSTMRIIHEYLIDEGYPPA